ncbi:MAG: cell division protein FtsL [bacterium]|nr:cell division protein FtsL [bacterium]
METRVLTRPQKVHIFSKQKHVKIRVRLPFLVAVVFALLVGIFAVWERIHYLQLGTSIERYKQENRRLVQLHRNLRLEYNTSISLDKVEAEARENLKMQQPDEGQIVYVR